MPIVELNAVQPHAAPVLANLIQLYCHDLAATFGLKIGTDGRFAYPLQPYWDQPETHFAFFIMAGQALAGFALATRGSLATTNPHHLDVAEFFVLRTHRTAGVGAKAACLLWNRLVGHWVVRAAVNNTGAVAFWQRTVVAYAGAAHTRYIQEQGGQVRQVFEFDTQQPSSG